MAVNSLERASANNSRQMMRSEWLIVSSLLYEWGKNYVCELWAFTVMCMFAWFEFNEIKGEFRIISQVWFMCLFSFPRPFFHFSDIPTWVSKKKVVWMFQRTCFYKKVHCVKHLGNLFFGKQVHLNFQVRNSNGWQELL